MTGRAADDLPDDELFGLVSEMGLAANLGSAPGAPPEMQEAAETVVGDITDELK